jgi:hypothetical protein
MYFNYKGQKCMIKPKIIRNNDTLEINRIISLSMADFVSRHFKIGQEIKLLNIKPEYEDVTIDDLRAFTDCSRIIVLNGNTFYNTDEAMNYFSRNFSKLIMYFDYDL